MPESWRNPDVIEFGNAIRMDISRFEHALTMLHRDAAKTLPPGTRYDIRTSGELASGGGIAWYGHTLMAGEPTWNGFGPREGYYLVGQYTTPIPAKNPENGGAA